MKKSQDTTQPDEKPKFKKLKPIEVLFVQYYLELWSAAKAATKAGYNGDPAKVGWSILQRPHIIAAVEEAVKQTGIKPDETIARLTQQARLNISDFMFFKMVPVVDADGKPELDDKGEIKTRPEYDGVNWQEVINRGYLIKGVTYTRSGKPVLEFYDSQRALELIGRSQRLFLDRVENTNINVDITADDLATARDKARAFEKALIDG